MNETVTHEPIDLAIGGVERLYHSITGREAPPVEEPHAPMPPEKAPERHIEEQMERLMDGMSRLLSEGPARPWTPAISVSEGTEDLRVSVDLPGVPREHVRVRLAQPGLLEISGRRPDPCSGAADAPRRARHAEPPHGPFLRWVALPPTVAEDRVAARLADGVLEVRIPRGDTATTAGRSIPVR